MASFFGLDLGSSQIKVAQAESSGQGFKLQRLAVESMINETETETISKVIKTAGIRLSI